MLTVNPLYAGNPEAGQAGAEVVINPWSEVLVLVDLILQE